MLLTLPSQARLCHIELQKMLKRDIFLDSDDLQDLRGVQDDVRDSEVLVLFQSKGVLTRPWVSPYAQCMLRSSLCFVRLDR